MSVPVSVRARNKTNVPITSTICKLVDGVIADAIWRKVLENDLVHMQRAIRPYSRATILNDTIKANPSAAVLCVLTSQLSTKSYSFDYYRAQ